MCWFFEVWVNLSLVSPRAEGKGISLDIHFETSIPERVISDPTRLRQILLNLLGNAIKFTEVGGVSIYVACRPAEQELTFRVVDTGIGMTEEQRRSIAGFSAFNQADTSVTRRFGGSGLPWGRSSGNSQRPA